MAANRSQIQDKPAACSEVECSHRAPLGAIWQEGACGFTVWAPFADRVEVRTLRENRAFELDPIGEGYFRTEVRGIERDSHYFFRLDKKHSVEIRFAFST